MGAGFRVLTANPVLRWKFRSRYLHNPWNTKNVHRRGDKGLDQDGNSEQPAPAK